MTNIAVPVHLDAFALSPPCCDEGVASRIAPYTQPNYTALRLDSHLLQHDILDHVDLHNSRPAAANPRISSIGGSSKFNRLGVHLQWSLPRLYRTANASGRDPTIAGAPDGKDATQPVFRQIPNRWLVVRRLKNPQRPKGVDEFTSWVVESDAVRNIKTIAPDVDLESEVSPFVSYAGNPDQLDVFNKQTEWFVGQKIELSKLATTPAREYLKDGVTVMTSSNPIFADYALHNTNVLSVIDNFSYPLNKSDGNNFDSQASYLKKALCDYFVLGWHQDPEDDPLNNNADTIKTRLDKLLLTLSPQLNPTSEDLSLLGNKTIPARILVHGAIYDVRYNFDKRPAKSLVDIAARNFGPDTTMEPLSLGTTPLDGILTFLDAHKQSDPTAASMEAAKFFDEQAKDLPKYVLELSTLLYAAGDDYDSRVQAQDLIAQQNYAKSDGGSHWTFSVGGTGPASAMPALDGKPKMPTQAQLDRLAEINEMQTRLDVAKRKLKGCQWNLFAEWFKFKSEYIDELNKDTAKVRHDAYKKVVDPLLSKIPQLQDLIADLEGGRVLQYDKNRKIIRGSDRKPIMKNITGKITAKRTEVDCKQSTKDPFQQRSDPTLTIAGVDSGWPENVTDKLQVRTDTELTSTKADLDAVDAIFAATPNGRPKLTLPITPDPASQLDLTARKILAECLRTSNMTTTNGKGTAPKITGFQAWDEKNPFAPLFIEWEAIYYHIDKDQWDVQLRPSPVGHAHPQVRYTLKDLLVSSDPAKILDNASKNQNNFRTISGRALISPQPRYSLESVVVQVLDSKSPDIPADIKDDVITDLKSKIRELNFISAPLSGLTNHLLTRCEGAHVRPNVRVQGEVNYALKAADASDINIDVDVAIPMIDAESALTPYGGLMAFSKAQYAHNPFKPVTHGQFMFTKLNIVDKFGQAISLPFQKRRRVREVNPPPVAVHPCLSDYLTPDVVNTRVNDNRGTLNTVFPIDSQTVGDGKWPQCPFAQLTPSINQEARINGSFLKRDTNTSPWREVTDYEPPIWGWIIINYADNGLQFFLGDGRFYREIRRGGVQGTNLSTKWLPYGPPDASDDPAHDPFSGSNSPEIAQMDELIDLFVGSSDPNDTASLYLLAFANMINEAIKNMPFPPSSYAGFANAIVGKPLALVNVGWSIELAAPPIEPQFQSDDLSTDRAKWGDGEPGILDYNFPLKIGDKDRNFDGVVGYYNSDNSAKPSASSSPTNWSKLFTYFVPAEIPPPKTAPSFANLDPANFLSLKPYYIDPEPSITPSITVARCSKYTVTSLLMDPYTPIHGYSPILPTKKLTLPSWTVQSAMDKMHAFFRLGPILVTDNVPSTFTEAGALLKNVDGSIVNKHAVKLPVSGRKGTWNWLQPYVQDGDDNGTQFAKMGVDEDLGNLKFEPAPYTFLEGYLELMGRLDNKGDGKTEKDPPVATGAGGGNTGAAGAAGVASARPAVRTR